MPDFDDVLTVEKVVYISDKVFANMRWEAKLGHEQQFFQTLAFQHFNQSHRAPHASMTTILVGFDNHLCEDD